MNTLNNLLKDLADDDLPKRIDNYDKVKTPLKPGMKVGWYFKDDEAFLRSNEMIPRDHACYSGIVVPAPDVELRGATLEPEECVIVMTDYPCEKCYPEATWFALRRLLDNDELVEIFAE